MVAPMEAIAAPKCLESDVIFPVLIIIIEVDTMYSMPFQTAIHYQQNYSNCMQLFYVL